MSDIKNIIITISGQPVSGKSTLVKALKEKYEKMGFKVHIEPIGHYWREAAIETYKKLKPHIENPTLDQIHADPDFENFRKEIDLALDEKVRQRGEEINSQARPDEVFIFDSRMAWKKIPSAFAVRATVDSRIAGLRVYNDDKRGSEDKYESEEAAIEATKVRTEEEIARFKMRYDVDLEDIENYNMVVDTSFSNTDELAEIIIEGERAYREGREYPKLWASPITFLSEQREQDTNSRKVQQIVEEINKNGFNTDLGTVEIAEDEGMKILLNGKHRICAQLSRGKTLIPYKVISKNNEHSKEMARIIYEDRSSNHVYDWANNINYFGGTIGGLGIEQIRDLKYLNDLRSGETLKSLRDFHVLHFPIVRKKPQFRKLIDFEMSRLKVKNGENR